ncbi:protein NRT1/ PTR FAMILY 5.5-like [Salvia splendens]|uniref:protein NRT1/ PTR FAMILY 5.5-like n=1 Tax=Salvia splendens TaxID=180675 RepID=UPI001C25BA14|nr:protein NRT1/ PTR FAMILY 5.5-like [Salvia splendens]
MVPNKEAPSWFRLHIGFSFTNSIIFILGLIWSYRMVEKTFLDILITRMWKLYDLKSSVVVVNLHEVITICFVVVFSTATDVYRGRSVRFWMVVFSTTVCIIGLMLNYLEAGNDDKGQLHLWLFFSMGLMDLAQAGLRVTLRVFLEDQFREVDREKGERRLYTKLCWILVSAVAVIFAQFETLTGFHFRTLLLALTSVIAFFFIVFVSGFNFYHKDGESNERNDVRATNEDSKWKMRVILFLVWVSLSILSLVSASGSTFFLIEAITLTSHHKNLFSILVLANLVRCMETTATEVSRCVVAQLKESRDYNIPKMELLRIGIGLGCCMMCCSIAEWTGTHRKYAKGGSTMSVYWLIPQFFLLGLMRGFAKDGFKSLFESRVRPWFKGHGRSLGVLTTGFGSILSIVCVFIYGSGQFKWFQNDIHNSSLNKYYSFLSVLSWANFGLYILLFVWYTGFWILLEDQYMYEARDKQN